MSIFERTFVITRVLYWLAAGVAAIGLVSALLAWELERARALALLRTLGVTPAGTALLVPAQTLFMGVVALLAAVPAGLLTALVLTAGDQPPRLRLADRPAPERAVSSPTRWCSHWPRRWLPAPIRPGAAPARRSRAGCARSSMRVRARTAGACCAGSALASAAPRRRRRTRAARSVQPARPASRRRWSRAPFASRRITARTSSSARSGGTSPGTFRGQAASASASS